MNIDAQVVSMDVLNAVLLQIAQNAQMAIILMILLIVNHAKLAAVNAIRISTAARNAWMVITADLEKIIGNLFLAQFVPQIASIALQLFLGMLHAMIAMMDTTYKMENARNVYLLVQLVHLLVYANHALLVIYMMDMDHAAQHVLQSVKLANIRLQHALLAKLDSLLLTILAKSAKKDVRLADQAKMAKFAMIA